MRTLERKHYKIYTFETAKSYHEIKRLEESRLKSKELKAKWLKEKRNKDEDEDYSVFASTLLGLGSEGIKKGEKGQAHVGIRIQDLLISYYCATAMVSSAWI